MKPIKRKNYGSIPYLNQTATIEKGGSYMPAGQEKILTEKTRDRHDLIVVTEKYDGSNIGIARKGDQIFALTRSGYEAHTSPYGQHHIFSQWVKDRKADFLELLADGERLVGEWLYQVHGTFYKIADSENPVVFFGLIDNVNRKRTRAALIQRLEWTDYRPARLLHDGPAITPGQLVQRLNEGCNYFTGQPPEGMVYQCERKGFIDFMGKWVRPGFEPGKYCINIPENELRFNVSL